MSTEAYAETEGYQTGSQGQGESGYTTSNTYQTPFGGYPTRVLPGYDPVDKDPNLFDGAYPNSPILVYLALQSPLAMDEGWNLLGYTLIGYPETRVNSGLKSGSRLAVGEHELSHKLFPNKTEAEIRALEGQPDTITSRNRRKLIELSSV